MNELDQLYQQVILDHSRERHGQGLLEAPQGDSFQVNPTCGDEVQLQVRLEGQTLAELGWQGSGCSISQASISVMNDLVVGKNLEQVRELEEDFDALMHSRGQGVSKYPNRVKCALLGWMALKDAVAKAVVNGENQVASGSASAAHCDE